MRPPTMQTMAETVADGSSTVRPTVISTPGTIPELRQMLAHLARLTATGLIVARDGGRQLGSHRRRAGVTTLTVLDARDAVLLRLALS